MAVFVRAHRHEDRGLLLATLIDVKLKMRCAMEWSSNTLNLMVMADEVTTSIVHELKQVAVVDGSGIHVIHGS